jgi:transposase
VTRAGLLGPDGVVVGRYGRAYLRHDGPEHVLCFAPTRSGKGVGLVVPSLLTWPGSAIVHDIKGENWTLTAGFRARYGRVLLFDPTNAASAAYNPLLEVRKGEWEVRDVQNIADILVDPEGSLERRNHWEKTSHSLLVGTILHVLYADALRRTRQESRWRGRLPDGPMDGLHFLAYVEQILAPTLKKGQIVFLDNVSTHKVDGVEEAIEARGARPIFLPAYSPDLNPIEQLFARLKSFLRKMKARTVEQLWRAIASFLKGVSKDECKAYLANSGYT